MLQIETQWLAYGLIVIPIASVHFWLPAFTRKYAASEDAWIGFTGGVALGYLMMYMLPKVSAMTMQIILDQPDAHHFSQSRAYLVLIAGMIAYLAIDRLDQSTSPRANRYARGADYSVHGAYNLLAGYVAVELPAPGLTGHFLISMILVLHMMGMANLFYHKHPNGYPNVRWYLMFLVLLGGSTALLTELPRVIVNATTAFVGGIILLNVVSEELPTGQKQRFKWFLFGITAVLIAMFVLTSIIVEPRPMLKGIDLL